MDYLKKFIMFDKFITPSIVQIFFWIIAGAALLITLFGLLGALFNGELALFLLILIIAPILILVIRIYMELILLFFKIYEKLHSIDERLKKNY